MSHIIPATLLEETTPAKGNVSLRTKKSLLRLGKAGHILLLCIGLLAGSLLAGCSRAASSADEATGDEIIETSQAAEPAEAVPVPADNKPDTTKTEAEPVAEVQTQPAAEVKPVIGELSFAVETTAAGVPVEPGFSFEQGISQLHAVFEYANLKPDHLWTQVWYHNGAEIVSTSQPWLEAESGTFDYIIRGGGAPLPAGEWALEFYINDELLTAGSFTIESEVESSATEEVPSLADLPRVYRLVYTKWNGEKHDLYVGDTNGSQEQFILSRVAGPSWSPDGRYIFFYGEEGIDQQIINGRLFPLPGATNGIVRLNASPIPAGIQQISLFQGHGWNDGTARSANVSPDGSMIAYDGDRGGGRRIYFLGTDANQQFRFEIIGEQADWAPDSQRIVYRSGRNNQVGLWISNRTDSGHVRITSGGTDSFPTWSPDGQTIAFSRDAGGNVDIYRVNADGSNLQRLTDAPGHDTLPLYLPNGDLVFRSARTGGWSIWKMNGDGSEQTQIIAHAPVGPEWSFSAMDVLR
jgi:hypothetical protein